MDKKLFELGLSKRKATLGSDYVEKNLASADDFNRDFQEQMTEWCWGFGWGDDTIDERKPIIETPANSPPVCLLLIWVSLF